MPASFEGSVKVMKLLSGDFAHNTDAALNSFARELSPVTSLFLNEGQSM